MLKTPLGALALEPADGVGAKSDDVFGTEVINVPRGGEADRRRESAEADREIEVAVEQAVDQARNKRVSGADSVDDLHHIGRGIAKLTTGQQQCAGLGAGRPRQRNEWDAVACGDRRRELLACLIEAKHALCIPLGEDQQMQMRHCCFEQRARFQ